jgi:type VI secretion system secreted protein VgrG
VTEETGTYLITAIHHSAHENSYLHDGGSESDYTNDFTCIPGKVHYRPALVHPKPVMSGPQSAIVVGPSGEEIYVDEYGRIKVQFHWDRIGKNDENSTCYIQVMQPWAGSGWGTSFIPRIGMEVVVNFYNGDVDRPIIIGTVYNNDNRPPFESKTQIGIKTHSTTGGTTNNYNAFIFDDSKGSEEVYIHAEKNMNVMVKNNVTQTVHNDLSQTVNNNLSQTILVDKSINIGGNHTENIAADTTINIGGNCAVNVAGKKDYWTVDATAEGFLGAKTSLMVGLVHETLIGGKVSANISAELAATKGIKVTIADAKEIRKSKFLDIEATARYILKSPYVVFDVDKILKIEAGGTTIIADSSGVEIIGDVNITGDVKVTGSISASKNLSAKNFKSS